MSSWFAKLVAFGGWFPDVYQLWCLEIRGNTLIDKTYAYFKFGSRAWIQGVFTAKKGELNCNTMNQIYKPDSMDKTKNKNKNRNKNKTRQKRNERKRYENRRLKHFRCRRSSWRKRIFIHLLLLEIVTENINVSSEKESGGIKERNFPRLYIFLNWF